ncbi:MAG: aminotransferase class I/II-fold pyridoxal phosphate-dependent enzyme [Candidatus Marinimicrobia bacterium]|nr:aminotransferase class I/II-fold pyridoxal phosphate-dependent enzyme [Candidatus Neomarinimicrobiota bacterium]
MKKFVPEQALTDTRREFGEHGGVTPSVERSSTFTVLDPHTMPEIFNGIKGPEQGGCFLYSRHFNPTTDTLARYLAAMEGTEYAVATSSGMAAITSTILQICHSGDHLVASNTIYGGTHAFFEHICPQMGISVTFVDPDDSEAFENGIEDNTKLLYTESISNPTLKVSDIPVLSQISKKYEIKLVIDNTFTPMMISPIELGADIVVYSMTKFINGASDLIAGAVCASKEFIFELMDLNSGRVMLLGPTLDPRAAYDIIQRLPHLAIRMREHSVRAMKMAEKLEELGVKVKYPGLKKHPQYDLFKSFLNEGYGFGGMFSVDCGDEKTAEEFMSYLQNEVHFGLIAVSLGYFDTLMSLSGSSTSSEIAKEEQKQMGLSPGLVRMAAGLTGSIEDRVLQLEKAVKEILM